MGQSLSRGWAARMSASYLNTFMKTDGSGGARPLLQAGSPRFSTEESCLLLGSPRSNGSLRSWGPQHPAPQTHLDSSTIKIHPHIHTHMANVCDLELAADHGEQLLMAQMGSKQASRKWGKIKRAAENSAGQYHGNEAGKLPGGGGGRR